MKNWSIKQKHVAACIFLCLFAVVATPFIYDHGWVVKGTNDLAFHFSRMDSLSNIWRSPINFETFKHMGMPANVFYPWLTLIPMYLIHECISANYIVTFYAYAMLITLITGGLCYYVYYKMKGSIRGGLLYAALYCLCAYRTYSIYTRHGIGEFVSMAFFPLVLYGVYQIFYEKKPRWVTLAIGMTLIGYTHFISLVLMAGMVGLFFFVRLCRRQVNKVQCLALAKAAGASILMCAFAFVPMLEFKRYTNILMPQQWNLQQRGLYVGKMLIDGLSNTIESGGYSLGFVLTISSIILVLTFKKWRSLFAKDMMIVAFLCLFLASNLFPWQIFQHTPAILLQFPYRFYGIVMLLLSFLAVDILNRWLPVLQKNSVLVAVIGVLVLVQWGTVYTYMQMEEPVRDLNFKILDSDNFKHRLDSSRLRFAGYRDYAPKIANQNMAFYLEKNAIVNGEQITTKPSYTADTATFNIKVSEKGYATVPVMRYVGERVTVNGKIVQAQKGQLGATRVPVQEGKNTIRIGYRYTTIAKASAVVSVIATISVITIVFYQRYKCKKREVV